MDYVLQTFGDLKFGSVIVFMAAIVVIAVMGAKIYKFICEFHDDIQNRKDAFDKMKEDTETFQTQMKEVQPVLEKITDTLDKSQAQIFEVIETQNFLIKEVKTLAETQNSFSTQFNNFKSELDEQQLNKLRDRLLQIYRFYSSTEKNPLQAWTEMEKDAFDKLFKDYERLGGDGYMHSVVEPAMRSLEIVKMKDIQQITELMNSRKNG